MTNVRFTQDKRRIISIGGADHAIFQWRFIADEAAGEQESTVGGFETKEVAAKLSSRPHDEDDLPRPYEAYMDSNSEDSDSEMSGKEIDSDIENEKEISYDRVVYKDDLKDLKPKIKEEIKKSEAEQSYKRLTTPETSLSLEFVYGYTTA